MNISESGGIQGPRAIEPTYQNRLQKTQRPQTAFRADRAEISEEARFFEKLRAMPEVREGKVAELKKLIAGGEYETDERLQAALERFLAEEGPF